MSLILATGSNQGDSLVHLEKAKQELSKHFNLIGESSIYKSSAVDFQDQPDFYNQVLEFEIPDHNPSDAMKLILEIEAKLGRVRTLKYRPRTIDIDIIFWGLQEIRTEVLIAPHPKWRERSFIVKPLQQLPFFQSLEKCFKIPTEFEVDATPIS